MNPRAIPAEVLAAIAAAGFDVYQREPGATYLYYTDGTRIGYVENSYRTGLTISTVHIPNHTSGTGFGAEAGDEFLQPEDFTRERLEHGFALAPRWADTKSRNSVRKWPSWEAFAKSGRFMGGFKLVAGASFKAE